MKTTVTFSDFRQAFKAIRPDNFSHEGLEQLWDYFESYERDTGEEIELDVIAICCEYSEQTWQAIASDYDVDIDENENEEEQAQQVMNFLCDHTSVMGSSTPAGTIIYQNF